MASTPGTPSSPPHSSSGSSQSGKSGLRHLSNSFRAKYSFRWEVLDIIIGGKSSVDSIVGFHVKTVEDSDRFIQSYGFDLSNPIENAEVLGNFREALSFIKKFFLQPDNPNGLKLEIPRKIQELVDVRQLFLMANLQFTGQTSDNSGMYLRNWACAVLKVMHTIAHIDKDIRTSYFTDIQLQIFDRFYRVIHRDAQGHLFLGDREDDPARINLIAFETKPKKTRDSIILKMLHKPENVAEDIFDRVGVRFVTATALDALRVVKYLKDQMIVVPANVKPSRSRNTLVDMEDFKSKLSQLFSQIEKGEINEDQFHEALEAAAHEQPKGAYNPHSSQFYRAIQFTCRQLIKWRNPLYEELKEIKGLSKRLVQASGVYDEEKPCVPSQETEDLLRAVERMDLKNIQREIRFFYPYEVQVMDQRAYEENERGRSAHSEYKKAQLLTAMRRVMGGLVDAVRQ